MSDVKLTYSQLLSSEPIPVGIGHIQPPKISDRRRIGEGLWMQYASYMTLTVDSYYSALLPDKYDAFWHYLMKNEQMLNYLIWYQKTQMLYGFM